MRIKNIFIALCVLFTTSATAQNEMGDMPKAPIDAAVKIGHLDNGLTYYMERIHYCRPHCLLSYRYQCQASSTRRFLFARIKRLVSGTDTHG